MSTDICISLTVGVAKSSAAEIPIARYVNYVLRRLDFEIGEFTNLKMMAPTKMAPVRTSPRLIATATFFLENHIYTDIRTGSHLCMFCMLHSEGAHVQTLQNGMNS